MPVITPDWSYFQNYLDKTFNRRIGIFRCSFSPDFADPRFLGNANLAKVLYDEGKVDGFICYQVLLKSYTVKQQYDAFWKQIGPNVPDWLLGVMEDLEVWGGKSYEQHGDMSAMYNQIAGMHAKEFGSLRTPCRHRSLSLRYRFPFQLLLRHRLILDRPLVTPSSASLQTATMSFASSTTAGSSSITPTTLGSSSRRGTDVHVKQLGHHRQG
jgi:hypothetical protein